MTTINNLRNEKTDEKNSYENQNGYEKMHGGLDEIAELLKQMNENLNDGYKNLAEESEKMQNYIESGEIKDLSKKIATVNGIAIGMLKKVRTYNEQMDKIIEYARQKNKTLDELKSRIKEEGCDIEKIKEFKNVIGEMLGKEKEE